MNPHPLIVAVQFALLAQRTGELHPKCHAFIRPRGGLVLVSV